MHKTTLGHSVDLLGYLWSMQGVDAEKKIISLDETL